ncbi:MAG: lasso peptide biosynthesis B2 protein [Cyanobacteria bacterium P01_A01_bin.84]
MGKLHKILDLSSTERNFLLKTLILMAFIRLGLRFLKFQNLLKLLKKISQLQKNSSERMSKDTVKHTVTVRKIIWAVNVVTRYMPGVKCLARALTTHVLMKRYGHTSNLQIGVAKAESGNLEAHAWIEYQEKIVIGNLSDISRFIPLPSLEGIKL